MHVRGGPCWGSLQDNERGQWKGGWLSRNTVEQLQINLKVAHSVCCVFILFTLSLCNLLLLTAVLYYSIKIYIIYTIIFIVLFIDERSNLIKLLKVCPFPPPLFSSPTPHPCGLAWLGCHSQGSKSAQRVKAHIVSQPAWQSFGDGERRVFWLRSNQNNK